MLLLETVPGIQVDAGCLYCTYKVDHPQVPRADAPVVDKRGAMATVLSAHTRRLSESVPGGVHQGGVATGYEDERGD